MDSETVRIRSGTTTTGDARTSAIAIDRAASLFRSRLLRAAMQLLDAHEKNSHAQITQPGKYPIQRARPQKPDPNQELAQEYFP
ncbi:hypothetical protein G3N57_16060 [Paraburkholderia sp. Se-20369]|nr:hypothetical protein [Paraburkholderia sp. Se-20369]